MTPAEALRDIRVYAAAGRVVFTRHARLRMAERGAAVADVVHALANAVRCRRSDEPGKWKALGPDLAGDELTAVVVIEAGLVVVTVF